MHTYREILSPGFSIDMIPPTTNAVIITTLTNLKKPDLFVRRVVTDENIIKINTRK
ncbi:MULTISPECIES: hypothetical protein [Clostridium]|jgi:hypothetical protein|uniref:Uncharacterized protein n=2 Tax=Clostridium TaxID=1485 RepID=A0AAX0B641_CLOBE|nr:MULTISPECIES: hypothetical protein [Clostridium]MBA8937391.1 hypothetical protein [Clostridium beijerinckii]MCI1478420.1 hypothetical protein [Clostridium beijerinckii]MCI1582902.1 hypothetical protein [Clostridium beijerinckii]MCI1623556.1 hypothetical protein [Clostridium beijerinckii]NOW07362.1 hypothetical protein [Clostridium beijerinckii]